MKRLDRGVAVVFLIFGVYVFAESHIHLPYESEYGPGPGFLPIWLGVFFIVVSIALFMQTFIHRKYSEQPAIQRTDLGGVTRAVTALAALLVCFFILDILGFFLSYAIFGFFLLLALERQHLTVKNIMLISVSIPAVFVIVFKVLLQVNLPKGILGI